MMTQIRYELSKGNMHHQFANKKFLNFLQNFDGTCYQTYFQTTTPAPMMQIIELASRAFAQVGIKAPWVFITDQSYFVSDQATLIIQTYYGDMWEDNQKNRSITFTLYGNYDIIKNILGLLKPNIPIVKVPVVTWEYMSGSQHRIQNIVLDAAKPVYDELYPWIGDVHQYFDDYLASEESVLILLGETGTGKTSFIRSLIWHSNLTTTFTYDSELLSTDTMFINFLVDDDKQLMVVEDADTFLTSREAMGNKIMSKFLNVSDGLASGRGKKKLIFTANIIQPNRIDAALMREGRCFDCKVFRRLTQDEARRAAQVAGLTTPIDKAVTLAELFSKRRRNGISRVGFA